MPLAITPTFRPWTHTSDDSYFYQLSLVVATATVSFILAVQRSFTVVVKPSQVSMMHYVSECLIMVTVFSTVAYRTCTERSR